MYIPIAFKKNLKKQKTKPKKKKKKEGKEMYKTPL